MIKKVDVQGRNANKNGKYLETQVEKEIAKYGIKSLKYKDMNTEAGQAIITSAKHGFLIKNVPYINVFGSRAFGEFVLYLFDVGPIRIECRSQHVTGTVQDKLPKLLEDCKCMSEHQVMIILEGNGFSQNARVWLKNTANAVKYKDIRVQTFAEFSAWLKNELVGNYNTTTMASVNTIMKNILSANAKLTTTPYIVTNDK